MSGYRSSIFAKLGNTMLKYLIMFYPIIISVGRYFNVVETLLTATMLFALAFSCGLKKRSFFKYLFICALLIISGYFDINVSRHISHVYVLLIFFFVMDCYNMGNYNKIINYLDKSADLVMGQLMIVLAINILYFFTSEGYSSSYTDLWSMRAFCGVYTDPHQAAYHFSALLVILLWLSHRQYNKMHYILLFGYEFCILMTGARVPTLLGIFIGVAFCWEHRLNSKSSERVQRVLGLLPMILLGCVALYIALTKTAFGQKLIIAMSATTFDSGRADVREMDFNFFKSASLIHKLFGSGTGTVMQSHATQWRSALWSHNDFTQMLCGMGCIMLVVYCFEYYTLLKRGFLQRQWLQIAGVIVLVAVAFLNGLYIHSRFVFVIPLMMSYFDDLAKKEPNKI